MADSQKTISFRGVDQGAGDMMSKLRQKSQELGESMIENTRKVSGSSRDFIQNLREQISLEEKRIRLREQAQKYEAQQTYQRESESPDFSVRSQAKENYKESVQEIEGESEQEKLQTDLLRELVEETKQRAREEVYQNREQVEQDLGMRSRGFFRGKEAKEPEDEQEALKQSYQKEILRKEDQDKALETLSDRANQYGENVSQAAMNPLGTLSQMGLFGSGALGAYALSRGQEYQREAGNLTGVTGFNYMESDRPMNPLTDIGIKNPELFQYTQNLARTRGYGTEGFTVEGKFDGELDPTREAGRLMTQERAFGLDRGFLSGLSQYQSFDVNQESTSGDVMNLINTMRQSGQLFTGETDNIDFSRLPELLETQNELAMQQVQHLSSINMSTNANIISAFEDVGGAFGNPLTQRKLVTGMDESLRNPQNQFQRAFDYSVIRNMDQDAGYLEVQKAMEQGLAYSDEDTGRSRLGQTLRQLNQRYGGSRRMLEMGIQGRFGDEVSFEQGETLAKAFQEDPDIFKGITGKQEALQRARDTLGMEDVEGKAKQQRSDVEALLATIDNTAASVGANMTEKLDKVIQKLDELNTSNKKFEPKPGQKGFGGNVRQSRQQLRDMKQNNKDNMKEIFGTTNINEILQDMYPKKNITFDVDQGNNTQ